MFLSTMKLKYNVLLNFKINLTSHVWIRESSKKQFLKKTQRTYTHLWQSGVLPGSALTVPKVASISSCLQQLLVLNQVQFRKYGWGFGALLLKNGQNGWPPNTLTLPSQNSTAVCKTNTKHHSISCRVFPVIVHFTPKVYHT